MVGFALSKVAIAMLWLGQGPQTDSVRIRDGPEGGCVG